MRRTEIEIRKTEFGTGDSISFPDRVLSIHSHTHSHTHSNPRTRSPLAVPPVLPGVDEQFSV